MTGLRDYQQRLLEDAETALQPSEARVMLQLPTGGGKTRIAGALLARWTRKRGKAAWLTHRKELADQTCGVLGDAGVWAVVRPEWDKDYPAPALSGGVVILMAQTVAQRDHFEGVWDEYGVGDLLIIDEAHHAYADGWERAINQWPGRVIGLTATPWRLSPKEGFDHLFDSLILGPKVKELQSTRSLAKARVLTPTPDQLIVGVLAASDWGYVGAEIERLNQAPYVWTGGVFDYWKRRADGRQTIVYAVSVGHAENLTAVFNDEDIPAEVIVGGTPTEQRRRTIEKFRNGEIRVLVNRDVATEGFDLPDAACMVLARPTLSLSLYLQMIGRGMRPKPDGGDCLILDLAGNVERHGLPEYDHQWSLEPRGGQDGNGESPVVRCPDCDAVSAAASHSCRDCRSPFGKVCQRCGAWRAWQRWTAETHCGKSHDFVCNLCHVDAHKLNNLPIRGGLREVLVEELAGREPEVNPSDLQTLEEVQAQMREIASNLAYTHNKATFNRLSRQFRLLLRRERQLRSQFLDQLRTLMDENQLRDLERYVGKISELDNFGKQGDQFFFEKDGRRRWLVGVTDDNEVILSEW